MHRFEDRNRDREVVEVTQEDVDRWNDTAKFVENSKLIVWFTTVLGVFISFGVGVLVGIKQLLGGGK